MKLSNKVEARVSKAMARKVAQAAKQREVSDAVILREALREYFAQREMKQAA